MSVTLAQLIRDARTRLGMTQGDLARRIGTSLENMTAIENGRNLQPSPKIIAGLARSLKLLVEDIYAAITGTLQELPWEKPRDLNLRDAELEYIFRQVDRYLEEEPRKRIKAFMRFTLDEERRMREGKQRRRRREDREGEW